MKYLITESQFDKVVFKYLDLERLVQIDKEDKIFFVNSERDEYAQIRYNKESGRCYISSKLINKISRFFSLDESEEIIGRWVENTLQMEVSETKKVSSFIRHLLRVSSK